MLLFLFTYLYLALWLDSFHQLSSMRKQIPGVQRWAPTFLRYPKIRCSVVNPQSVYLTPNRILVQSGDFGLTVRAGAWPAGTASTASGKDFLLHRNSVPTQTSSFFKFARPISSVIISNRHSRHSQQAVEPVPILTTWIYADPPRTWHAAAPGHPGHYAPGKRRRSWRWCRPPVTSHRMPCWKYVKIIQNPWMLIFDGFFVCL